VLLERRHFTGSAPAPRPQLELESKVAVDVTGFAHDRA
jgi:hypothetical protein